jgi:hypothetical protein
MDPIPATRYSSSTSASSRFDSCLRRFTSAGFRFVITAPSDVRAFGEGLSRFPERHIDPAAHVQWETDYRVFCGRGRQPHDRGSWRILAVDREDRVVGAITARLFCGSFVPEYLHLNTLLESTGPVFREHCQLAMAEVATAANLAGRTAVEISSWAVSPGWHAALVGVCLARAMGALTAAFNAPLVVLAADNRRGEVARLMRLGAAPLGMAGRYSLPPFVHHPTGAWLRLLLLDAPTFQVRCGGKPKLDLALLREQASIISTA